MSHVHLSDEMNLFFTMFTAEHTASQAYNPPQLISRFACPNLRKSKCSK